MVISAVLLGFGFVGLGFMLYQELVAIAVFTMITQIPLLDYPIRNRGGLYRGWTSSTRKRLRWRLLESSLLRIDLQSGTMGLHDVLRSWLAERAEHAAGLHRRLIDAWDDWNKLRRSGAPLRPPRRSVRMVSRRAAPAG